jgi:hypothetical protein
MWVCLNDSFLSIVEDYTSRANKSDLLVRARLKGDIETVFPDVVVRVDEGSDYKYRATVPRQAAADALAKRVMSINYDNFKDSVTGNSARHDAYMAIWSIMHRLQGRMSR